LHYRTLFPFLRIFLPKKERISSPQDNPKIIYCTSYD
jgi:hypothetical protein